MPVNCSRSDSESSLAAAAAAAATAGDMASLPLLLLILPVLIFCSRTPEILVLPAALPLLLDMLPVVPSRFPVVVTPPAVEFEQVLITDEALF